MSHDIPPAESNPHRPADDREEVYFSGSPVLRSEIGTIFAWWIVAAVLLCLPFAWRVIGGVWPHWAVGTIALPLAIIAAAMPVVLQKTLRYRISNYRIDFERGLLSRNIDTLELWHVEDINFHQSIFDRMLNTGTITVMSKDDTTPLLVIKGLPNPRPIFETLKQRIIAVKRQRGVIKMDIG